MQPIYCYLRLTKKKMEPKLNYAPKSCSFEEGFLGPQGNVGFMMVADYPKAKEIIERKLKEGRKIVDAEMGLDGDWGWNSMYVYDQGAHSEYDMHGGSIWAEPILIINYSDGSSETYPVWKKS